MKKSVKAPYSDAIAPRKLRAIVDLFRPATLFVVLICSLGGILAALGYNDLVFAEYWREAIYITVTFIIANAASNAWNQATDVKEDKISRPYRPIPQGIVSVEEAQTIAVVGFIFAIARGFLVSPSFGISIVALILICFLYSQEPVRLKKRLWLSNISLALSRGYIPVVAVFSVFGPIPEFAHLFGLGVFIMLIGGTSTKDLSDVDGDRAAGNNTPAVAYGVSGAKKIISPFLVIPYAVFVIGGMNTLLLLLPVSLALVYLLYSDNEEMKNLEYSKIWLGNYIVMMLMYLIFGITFYSSMLNNKLVI